MEMLPWRAAQAAACMMSLAVSGSAGDGEAGPRGASAESGSSAGVIVVTAKSGSPQDIQSAVDRADAAGGGTVRVPAGDSAFNLQGRTVTVPGGVNVMGAGKGKTLLRATVAPTDQDVFFFVEGVSRGGRSVRVSGLSLIGYRDAHPGIAAGKSLGIEISEVTDFRVDHCLFKDLGGRGIGVYDRPDPTITCRGVIDNCDFINTSGVPAGEGGGTAGPNVVGYGVMPNGSGRATDWTEHIAGILGKYDYGRAVVFVEDCYFRRWHHCVASNLGMHYVFRHNVVEGDCGFGSLDCHGGGYGAEGVGTRAIEVYDNVIKPPAAGFPWRAVLWLRGGGGVIFHNTVEGGYRSLVSLFCEGPQEKYWAREVWVWGNTLPADCVDVQPGTGDMACAACSEGVQYFRQPPDAFAYRPYPYPHPLRARMGG